MPIRSESELINTKPHRFLTGLVEASLEREKMLTREVKDWEAYYARKNERSRRDLGSDDASCSIEEIKDRAVELSILCARKARDWTRSLAKISWGWDA